MENPPVAEVDQELHRDEGEVVLRGQPALLTLIGTFPVEADVQVQQCAARPRSVTEVEAGFGIVIMTVIERKTGIAADPEMKRSPVANLAPVRVVAGEGTGQEMWIGLNREAEAEAGHHW